jgi:hypothetical protein
MLIVKKEPITILNKFTNEKTTNYFLRIAISGSPISI